MAPMPENLRPMDCPSARAAFDDFLCGELPPEVMTPFTEHIGACPDCAMALDGRAGLRRRLKSVVEGEAPPANLLASVQESIRAPQTTPATAPTLRLASWRPFYAAAAVVLLVLGGWAVMRMMNASPEIADSPRNDRQTDSLRPTVPTLQASDMLKIGLNDHVYCAVKYHLGTHRMPLNQMLKALGPQYAGLVTLVRHHAAGYDVMEAHQCEYDGRRFVHMILRDDRGIISLAITPKHGESFAHVGCKPNREVEGIRLFQAKMLDRREFEVTGFETREYLTFIVSDAGPKSNVQLAADLAPDMHSFLDKAPPPSVAALRDDARMRRVITAGDRVAVTCARVLRAAAGGPIMRT